MIRMFLSFAFICLLAISAIADTIRLKDGSIIKGRITGFSGGKFTVVIGDGPRQRTMVFDASEVESIEFDSRGPAAPDQAPRTVSQPQDRSEPVSRTGIPRVITTDTTTKTAPEKASPPAKSDPVPSPSVPSVRASTARPVEITVNVMADNTANGWTNTGWVVRKGQRIRIIGSGEVSLGGGRTTGPSGLYEVDDPEKLMQAVPTGALIAVIGDDNNDFIYIGADREFTARRDGSLFLGVNEGNLDDNSGAFSVKVEILPGD